MSQNYTFEFKRGLSAFIRKKDERAKELLMNMTYLKLVSLSDVASSARNVRKAGYYFQKGLEQSQGNDTKCPKTC